MVPNKPGSTEKATGRLEVVIKAGPLDPVTALAFSPDGKHLLVGVTDVTDEGELCRRDVVPDRAGDSCHERRSSHSSPSVSVSRRHTVASVSRARAWRSAASSCA